MLELAHPSYSAGYSGFKRIGSGLTGISMLLVLIVLLSRIFLVQHGLTDYKLLLESGLAQSKNAEISIIAWLPQNQGAEEIIRSIGGNREWDRQKITDVSTGTTLVYEKNVNLQEEKEIKEQYSALSQKVERLGGQLYLQEQIEESIDGQALLSMNNVVPSQWIKSENTWSWAGYAESLDSGVMAGSEKINMQVITRAAYEPDTEGNTVVAIPVLLYDR